MIYIRRHVLRFVQAVLLSLILLLVPVLLIRFSLIGVMYSAQDAPKSDVAIVLGASVMGGMPSPVLAERADAAIDLYQKGKVSKILVTGDNGALSHDEVTPVRKYLLAAGIPAHDIFLDHAGFDTYSSMYRARSVFEVKSAAIVTQDFHEPRAVFVARTMGIDAIGVVAIGDSSVFEYVREIPASWKALFDLLLKREPKYLGPQIPLSGDGQSTWY